MYNFDKKKSEILFLKVYEKNLTKNSRANLPRKNVRKVFARVLTCVSAHATLQPVRVIVSNREAL